MSMHTPGPWIASSEGFGWANIDAPNEGSSWHQLAKVAVKIDRKPSEEGMANARLIAAAPDLFAKLEACEKHLENLYGNTADGDEPNREDEEGWILLCEVRAVIGKAKGESPWTSTR